LGLQERRELVLYLEAAGEFLSLLSHLWINRCPRPLDVHESLAEEIHVFGLVAG
jgi:hypothetical protein